jgi:hypothetical protein
MRPIGEQQLSPIACAGSTQQGVLRDEGTSSLGVGFDQAPLGGLEHEVQTVEMV